MMHITYVLLIIALFSMLQLFPTCKAIHASGLDPFLNKQYELASSDANFEKIMKALGVGWFTRKAALLAKPVMKLTLNGDEYTLSSESTFKNIYTKFKMGQEFTMTTPDGRTVKSTFTQDKNTLTEVQKGKKTTTVIMVFTAQQVTETVKVDDIVSVRVYKPI